MGLRGGGGDGEQGGATAVVTVAGRRGGAHLSMVAQAPAVKLVAVAEAWSLLRCLPPPHPREVRGGAPQPYTQ